MSDKDEVPTVDPDNEKGKLELIWVVAIAVAVVVIALAVWRLTGRQTPAQTGLIGPSAAPATALTTNGQGGSVVPAH